MRYIYCSFLLLIVASCTPSTQCNWEKRKIDSFGIYCLNDQLSLKVYEKEYLLKYELLNNNEKIVVRSDERISVLHRWGIILDEKENLWIFSSDIGHGCWEKNVDSGKYSKLVLDYPLSKKGLSERVIEVMSEFE